MKYLNVSTQGARAGACVADTLALRHHQKFGGTTMRRSLWRSAVDTKLRRFLDLKLTHLLLDPSLNSRTCALANIARICGLCGLRFSWLIMRRCPQLELPAKT